jgi:hypothetical protein
MDDDAMRFRVTDNDEFLLSELLDGSLEPSQAARLRARLEQEPELRAAYESLARVDRLVASQQSDRPRVDLQAMRRHIMAEVAQTENRSVIPIQRWLRVAAPLAAAAAIALVVSIYRPMVQEEPRRSVVHNVHTEPQPEQQPRRLLVHLNRPEQPADERGIIRVSYARTTELAEAMRERDMERRSRPVWHMYVAEAGFSLRGRAGEVPPL